MARPTSSNYPTLVTCFLFLSSLFGLAIAQSDEQVTPLSRRIGSLFNQHGQAQTLGERLPVIGNIIKSAQEIVPKAPARSTSNSGVMKRKKNGHGGMIHEWISAHNKVREALGETSLQWNSTVARYARRWASQRIADCDMIHSNHAHPEVNIPYGENIFWGSDYNLFSITDAVRSWADEAKFYDPFTNHCTDNEACGHYTQIAWRDSLRLGCHKVKCDNGGVFMTCNYDPPGNYVDQTPFGKAIKPAQFLEHQQAMISIRA